MIAISVDSCGQSLALKNEMQLPFQLLSDEEREVIKRYHLLNIHEHGGIAYPAVFLVKSTGEIGYRSLDRTAQRVNLAEILDYLEVLQRDPDHRLAATASAKRIIIPTASTLKQIGRNLFMQGNLADWKHYLGYPLFVIRYLLGIARRPKDQQ